MRTILSTLNWIAGAYFAFLGTQITLENNLSYYETQLGVAGSIVLAIFFCSLMQWGIDLWDDDDDA